MKQLNEICQNINKAVEDYETCKLGDIHTQSNIGRALAVNLKYLSDYKVEYHERHNQAFIESGEKSDKKKEMEADIQVPELYKIRQIQRSAEKVLEVIRSTISANKAS